MLVQTRDAAECTSVIQCNTIYQRYFRTFVQYAAQNPYLRIAFEFSGVAHAVNAEAHSFVLGRSHDRYFCTALHARALDNWNWSWNWNWTRTRRGKGTLQSKPAMEPLTSKQASK